MEEYALCDNLIFVSTDKACKPINVYGMCKSISEQLYMNMANVHNDMSLRVKMVRYGNVGVNRFSYSILQKFIT